MSAESDLREDLAEAEKLIASLREDLDAAHDEIADLTRSRDEARERVEKLESVLADIEETARAAQ